MEGAWGRTRGGSETFPHREVARYCKAFRVGQVRGNIRKAEPAPPISVEGGVEEPGVGKWSSWVGATDRFRLRALID